MLSFDVIEPRTTRRPLLVSVPHSGTWIPDNLRERLNPRVADALDDTDWFVDRLYDFAPEIGATMIVARASRYLVDLNRDPADQPLYEKGRFATAVLPTLSFSGEPLYPGRLPDAAEREARLRDYYWPFHHAIEQKLQQLRSAFGGVLLWDAHSIRRRVPAISAAPFPDMILGDRDGASSPATLSQIALTALRESKVYEVAHNTPFKGGQITQRFGRPQGGICALQLEMSKDLYLDDAERAWDPPRAAKVAALLRRTLVALLDTLEAS